MSVDNYRLLLQEDYPDGTFYKKVVKVTNSSDFVYKLQKTQIKARDGAEGLYKYLVNCYENKFCECLADKVLITAMDNIKEYNK